MRLFFELGSGIGYSLRPVSAKNPETEIGGGRAYFQSTLWSIVLRAKDPCSQDRREALQKLIETYWKPLYSFVRRKGNGIEESKDITQGFFCELLSKDTLKYLDRGRGRFRTFLLLALEHYMADAHDRSRAQKRGGGRPLLSLDFQGAEEEVSRRLETGVDPDRELKRDWAVRVMSQAMEALRASFEGSGRSGEFETFKGHLRSTHPEGVSYEEMAKTLGISVEDVRNRVRGARTRYREAILDVIRAYSNSEEETQDELRELLTSFS